MTESGYVTWYRLKTGRNIVFSWIETVLQRLLVRITPIAASIPPRKR